MPIYEYRCSACNFEKEALQKMSDAPLVECPKCGQRTLVKLVSAAGFQLKGSGWYATDFKNSGGPKADKSDKGDQAKAEPAGTKSEASAGETGSASGDAKSAEKAGAAASTPASTPASSSASSSASGSTSSSSSTGGTAKPSPSSATGTGG